MDGVRKSDSDMKEADMTNITPIREEDKRSDIEKAFDNYNLMAKALGLRTARTQPNGKLAPHREKALRLRLAEIGGLEVWNEALAKLEASSFCQGNNPRGWKASFDFMLQPSSLWKLLEGSYDD